MRNGHHPGRAAWPGGVAAAALAFAALGARAGEPTRFDSVVRLNGTAAGAYSEATERSADRIVDTVDERLALNRLGSRVLIAETDRYDQDGQGGLVGGHFESASSKDAIATDIEVQGRTLAVTNRIGGKAYTRTLAFDGSLIGPEGVRRLMTRLRAGGGAVVYQTYVPVTSSMGKVTLTYQGAETIEVDGHAAAAFKYREATEGQPDAVTIWVDAAGYTLRASAGTPFGSMEFARGRPDPAVLAAGAALPDEVYDRTVAVSNIRIPHPRLVEAVRLEIIKKLDAADGWPAFASPTQHVVEQTPRRVVLEIVRPGVGDAFDRAVPTAADLAPNAVFQNDLPEMRRVAAEASAGETDPWKAALAIQAWTARNMTFDAGIAVVPASEVVRDRHGTCLGYSILLAGLARARGIPARVRMGYVYTGDMWGGHAWAEVFVAGRWLPLDAALYRPGVADAARIGATIETGEGGGLAGAGELAKLYGKIDVRTLGYRLERGPDTAVPADAPDHTVSGDVYLNPWLGVRVAKPAALTFEHLDAHWPDPSVLAMKGAGGEVSVRLLAADPAASLQADVGARLQAMPEFGGAATLSAATWSGAPVVRFRATGRAGVAVRKDDQLWMIIATGSGADVLLDQVLPGIALNDLGQAPNGAPAD